MRCPRARRGLRPYDWEQTLTILAPAYINTFHFLIINGKSVIANLIELSLNAQLR